MKQVDFKRLLNEIIEEIENRLDLKGEQYAGNQDKLYNFKEIAKIESKTPLSALITLFNKHYVVIKDWFLNGITPSYQEYNERIIDCINYLILAKLLLDEKYECKEEEDECEREEN